MGRNARIVYVTCLTIFAVMIVLALVAGLWIYAVFGLVFGGLFAYSGNFVLGKKWQTPKPAPTRKPVRRRRPL